MNNYCCFSYCLLTIINMGTLLFASKNEAAVICQVIYLPQYKKTRLHQDALKALSYKQYIFPIRTVIADFIYCESAYWSTEGMTRSEPSAGMGLSLS